MKRLFITFLGLTLLTTHAEYLGNLSTNPFDSNSIADPYSTGNLYVSNSVTNKFGLYGNPFSDQFATNPYATEALQLNDQPRPSNPRPSEIVSAKHVPTLDASARRSVWTCERWQKEWGKQIGQGNL